MIKIFLFLWVALVCQGQDPEYSHANRYSEFDKPLVLTRTFWLAETPTEELRQNARDVTDQLPSILEDLEASLDTPERQEEFTYVLDSLISSQVRLLVVPDNWGFRFHPVIASTPEGWVWIGSEEFWNLKVARPELFLSSFVYAGAFINTTTHVPTSFTSSFTNNANDFLAFTTGKNAQAIYLLKVVRYDPSQDPENYFSFFIDSKINDDLYEFFLMYGMNIKVIYPLAHTYNRIYRRTDALDPLADQWDNYLYNTQKIMESLETMPESDQRIEALIVVNSVVQVIHHFMLTVGPRRWYQVASNRERHQELWRLYLEVRDRFVAEFQEELFMVLFEVHRYPGFGSPLPEKTD